MINFREIFDIKYSYIGLVVIGIILFVLFLLDKRYSIKIIGVSFLVAGIVLGVVYLFGNMIVSSFKYRYFIEIISDNFFNTIIIFSVIAVIFGCSGIGIYKYIK